MEDKTQSEQRDDGGDLVLDLNFVPQWARKPPGENHYAKTRYRDEEEVERGGRSGERRGGRDRRRIERAERVSPGEHAPRHDRPHGERPRTIERVGEPRPERAERPPRESVVELPLVVSFLPEQQRLASMVRQIHHSRRAYPLIDLAGLLLQDPEGYLVKIEADKESSGFSFFQCRHCKAVAVSESVMVQHLLATHLEDVYERQEIETDPPAGQFVCVARCRLSGALIGPPNHHSYNERVGELHRTRFAHLSLDEYRRNIELVRDEALIEQWKQESRRKTVCRKKGSDPAVEPIDLRQAEADFQSDLPTMYEQTRRAIVPSKTAQAIEDRSMFAAIRRAWQKESRFPLSLSFSMRAAFRHMHLHLFKAGRINFVTHIKPHAIRPEDAIESIGEVLRFLKEHPGSTRQHLLEVLHPSLDPKSKEATEALQPLGWLIERGHIIEFFNGTLAVPLGRSR